MSATFSGFDHGDRVVINQPGTELHGRAGTVRNATTIREAGTYVPAYGITCDVPASNGQHSFVVRVAHLLPEGGEQL